MYFAYSVSHEYIEHNNQFYGAQSFPSRMYHFLSKMSTKPFSDFEKLTEGHCCQVYNAVFVNCKPKGFLRTLMI